MVIYCSIFVLDELLENSIDARITAEKIIWITINFVTILRTYEILITSEFVFPYSTYVSLFCISKSIEKPLCGRVDVIQIMKNGMTNHAIVSF